MKKAIFAVCLVSLFILACVGSGFTKDVESSGRIDIESESLGFELANVKSNCQADSLNPDNEKYAKRSWMAQMGLKPGQWQDLWIEFTPAASGFVIVRVRGSYYSDLKINRHAVWVDDVRADGKDAVIINGNFEGRSPEGKLFGWEWAQPSKAQYRTDTSFNPNGRTCVLVWHDNPLSAKIAVEAGERYRISARFRI